MNGLAEKPHLRTIPGDCGSQALKKRPEPESKLPKGESHVTVKTLRQPGRRDGRARRHSEAIFIQAILNDSRQILHLNDTSTWNVLKIYNVYKTASLSLRTIVWGSRPESESPHIPKLLVVEYLTPPADRMLNKRVCWLQKQKLRSSDR